MEYTSSLTTHQIHLRALILSLLHHLYLVPDPALFPVPGFTLSLSLFPDLVLFPFPALMVSHILHLDLYQDLDLFPDPALMAIPVLHLDLFLVLCQNLHCYQRLPPIVHQMSLYYLFLYLCHPTMNGLNGI